MIRTVDWIATLWAALYAALVSLALYLLFVPVAVGAGNAWAVLRYLASVALGTEVLPPPATVTAGVALAGIAVHLALSLLMTAVIAFVLHRWGLITGIVGGAVLGLAFFAINFFTLTALEPHMFAMAHWSVGVVHLVFGAVAGGVYEWLELEPDERAALETR